MTPIETPCYYIQNEKNKLSFMNESQCYKNIYTYARVMQHMWLLLKRYMHYLKNKHRVLAKCSDTVCIHWYKLIYWHFKWQTNSVPIIRNWMMTHCEEHNLFMLVFINTFQPKVKSAKDKTIGKDITKIEIQPLPYYLIINLVPTYPALCCMQV